MDLILAKNSSAERAQLGRRLAAMPGVRLLGAVASESDAIALQERTRPDLAVLDTELASGTGLNVLEAIRASGEPCRVLMLGNGRDGGERQRSERLGVLGFYDRRLDVDTMIEQVGALARDHVAAEDARVAAVEAVAGIWDDEMERGLRRLVQLACDVTDSAMGAISLVARETVSFRSVHRVPVRELPRVISACTLAIRQAGLLELEDLRDDSRFAGHALVSGDGGLRHYAGVALRSRGGAAYGALCVFGHRARRLGDAQRDHLELLARQAADDIELRARLHALEQRGRSRRRQTTASHLAMRDPLTALPNRTSLLQRLEQSLHVAGRDGHRLGLFVVGLDDYKRAGESIGTIGRDDLVAAVARRMVATMADCDLIARSSDDEFALVLGRLPGSGDYDGVARRLFDAVSGDAGVGPPSSGCSVGLALYPDHASTADELLRRARSAMQSARAAGGRRLYRYGIDATEVPQTPAREAAAFVGDLRRAMQAGEIRVAFQPQWDIASNAISGVEALVRWTHPTMGAVSPAQFIPLAEEHGMIEELSAHIFDRALAQWAGWKASGIALPRLALNVSALQVRPGLEDRIRTLLSRHGLPASDIELELTETAVLSDGPEVLQTLAALRDMGCTLSIDDFGVGYASLSMLQRLPISTLKIDRSFVGDMDRSPRSLAIVEAVVALGRSLGLRLVAEGVERPEQVAMLRRLGCGAAQGYLLAKPLAEAAFVPWMLAYAGRLGTGLH